MPKINPIVLGNILVKYQTEIYDLYLLSGSTEVCERLFILHQKLSDLILQIETLVVPEI
jgi:hypothetical protein